MNLLNLSLCSRFIWLVSNLLIHSHVRFLSHQNFILLGMIMKIFFLVISSILKAYIFSIPILHCLSFISKTILIFLIITTTTSFPLLLPTFFIHFFQLLILLFPPLCLSFPIFLYFLELSSQCIYFRLKLLYLSVSLCLLTRQRID